MENAPFKKFGVILFWVKLNYVPASSPLRLTAIDRAEQSPQAVSNADAVSGSKLVFHTPEAVNCIRGEAKDSLPSGVPASAARRFSPTGHGRVGFAALCCRRVWQVRYGLFQAELQQVLHRFGLHEGLT